MKNLTILADKTFKTTSAAYCGVDFSAITSISDAYEALAPVSKTGHVICLVKRNAKSDAFDFLRMASVKNNAVSKNKAVIIEIDATEKEFTQIVALLSQKAQNGDGLQEVYETTLGYCELCRRKTATYSPVIKPTLANA